VKQVKIRTDEVLKLEYIIEFHNTLLHWAFLVMSILYKDFCLTKFMTFFPRIVNLALEKVLLHFWQNLLVSYVLGFVFFFFFFLIKSFAFPLSVFRKCWQVRGFVSPAPIMMLSWQPWTNKEVMAYFAISPLLLKSRNSMPIKQYWQHAVTTSE